MTEIKATFECDTYLPMIDTSVFWPWYSSFPLVENNVRYAFTTYVRVRNSASESESNDSVLLGKLGTSKFDVKKFNFLPKMVFDGHEEYMYLRLVEDILSNGTSKDDRTGTGTMSKFGCQVF